ncbi:FCD domain-containing protein [Nocardia vinacea]|uniref:FCD domain-containing protein n=1 Tax=Nocardia vinacea TaxID=96468 RepID=A0ABZ1YXT2_9NOCA|nr:FCD domain-containing protein [Nocardia vinacea]
MSRVQALVADLDEHIRTEAIAPGQRVATMEQLREQSGLARQTIGEALRILAERGTIEIRPGRTGGIFVAQSSPVVRLRHTLLATSELDRTTVADAVAVREALEELIVTEAARHRQAKDVRELRKQLTVMKKAVADHRAFVRANWALHERIAAITPNELARGFYLAALRCVEDLSIDMTIEELERPTTYLQKRLAVHVELVDAIAAGELAPIPGIVARHNATDTD